MTGNVFDGTPVSSNPPSLGGPDNGCHIFGDKIHLVAYCQHG